MRSIAEQIISFMQCFPDQPELAIFKVADPSMKHVGGSHAGTRAEISPLHDQAVYSLEGEIPKGANSIDPCANDQDSWVGILFDILNDIGSVLHLCLLVW